MLAGDQWNRFSKKTTVRDLVDRRGSEKVHLNAKEDPSQAIRKRLYLR